MDKKEILETEYFRIAKALNRLHKVDLNYCDTRLLADEARRLLVNRIDSLTQLFKNQARELSQYEMQLSKFWNRYTVTNIFVFDFANYVDSRPPIANFEVISTAIKDAVNLIEPILNF